MYCKNSGIQFLFFLMVGCLGWLMSSSSVAYSQSDANPIIAQIEQRLDYPLSKVQKEKVLFSSQRAKRDLVRAQEELARVAAEVSTVGVDDIKKLLPDAGLMFEEIDLVAILEEKSGRKISEAKVTKLNAAQRAFKEQSLKIWDDFFLSVYSICNVPIDELNEVFFGVQLE